jgi:hypothetical protein
MTTDNRKLPLDFHMPNFASYAFAYCLDRYFDNKNEGIFDTKDYHTIAQAFETLDKMKERNRFLELLKTFTKEKVITRTQIVAQLGVLLRTIKGNTYAIQGSRTT